ncbi:MAG TPA: CsbD family protein [Polyangiaceae bacterium]|nr:CsbD family protein [Polyangiaceae bacterium]
MSNASKRSAGAAEKLGGKIKGGIGKLVGSERMQADGAVKEAKGRAKEQSAKAAERVKGKVEEATGALKNRVGAVIDNRQMKAEGKLRELRGQARQRVNSR